MIDKIPTQTGTREQLVTDLKTVIHDAEAWLRNGGALGGEELKAKFETTLASAKAGLAHYQETVVDAAKATDEYVKENPWKSVGLGAAVGVVVGMLIARK
ncbi:DUF883 family protein [Massilia sp. DD77]|uniref:DUF883 family protein n=1 Tax=Massilia sp. DD77 TaxID=3109349 RepID=UPI002FFE73BD